VENLNNVETDKLEEPQSAVCEHC